jgi:predicted TIM-barrel fold metal-dependent hydrolase
MGALVVHEAVRRSLGSDHPISTDCLREYNVYVSTQTDDDFTYVMSYAGEENLVIGTDYGHGDTSSELNAIARFRGMKGLGDEVKRKILSDNPRRFYGI